MNKETSSNILDNSFDLLYPTIQILKRFDSDNFFTNDIKELKAALITITISVELLLKCKIASINWKLLFSNPDRADQNNLKSGSFQSVKFECCIKRIEANSYIQFDSKTKKGIEKIRKIRNKIAHFHHDVNPEDLISLISIGLDIFIEFYRNYIYKDLLEYADRTKEIENTLKEVKIFVKTRLTTLEENHKTNEKPKSFYFSECSNCLQNTLIIIKENESVKCVFCGHMEDIKWVAEIHSNYKNETKVCPRCKFNSMTAIHSKENEEEAWDCIICGYFINRARQWSLN